MISSDYNKRKPLFRIAVGAIIAILLFGIGTTGVISGTNATADAFSGTALANAGFFINVSFSTINSTIGNWSVNVTNPLNNSGYQLDSGWINLNINSTGAPQYVVGVNNSIIGNGFSSVNGTIYISLDTSNITDPNTFDVTFTNLDNMSENVTVAGLKFVAGNLGMVNISELSATTTVGSNATYILNLTNNGTATDTYTIKFFNS